jgi:hypothetical protein
VVVVRLRSTACSGGGAAPYGSVALGQIRTHRTLVVDEDPAVVWAALERVEEYPAWWPWLRGFDAEALAPGDRWSCRIRPPLPWSLDLEVHLTWVGGRAIRADIAGDIEGTADVVVRAAGDGGSAIALAASLQAWRGPTAVLHRLAPPVSRWAHDRVIDAAFAQFCERALGGDGTREHPSR